MKIKRIEIENFRAFIGKKLNLNLKKGENLLVYGENGSGKSSLYHAIHDFLESSDSTINIDETPYRNLFAAGNSETKVCLTFSDGKSYEWSNTKENQKATNIRDINKTKGFVDYKKLLHTYFLQQEENSVNVFKFFVETLLSNSYNDTGSWTFGEKWQEIQAEVLNRNTSKQNSKIQDLIEDFNGGLRVKVEELEKKAQLYLESFFKNIVIKISFGGVNYPDKKNKQPKNKKIIENQEIKLKVKFFGEEEDNHHQYLNEARLSAIALSIFLASLPIQPGDTPRIIALDDVLIGLDTSNRYPLLKILETYFENDQVFFFTYDRAWYENAREVLASWKTIEMYVGTSKNIPSGFPVIIDKNLSYHEKAKRYFACKDYPAAANYLRKEIEKQLKCKLPLTYKVVEGKHKDVSVLQLNDLVTNLVKLYEDCGLTIPETLFKELNILTKFVFNPMSHDDISSPIYKSEVENAFNAVVRLKSEPIIYRKKIIDVKTQFSYTNIAKNYEVKIETANHLYSVKYDEKSSLSNLKFRVVEWIYKGVKNSNFNETNNKSVANDKYIATSLQERTLDAVITGICKSINILKIEEKDFIKELFLDGNSLKHIIDSAKSD